jgi:hypothetical protein
MESVMTSKPQTVTTSPDKMETSVTDTNPARSERHARTGALETNTPEVATPHKPPTVAQVLAQQNAEPSAPLPLVPKEEILPPACVVSEEGLERNLALLSGSALLGTMINFNGQTGIYRVIRDGTEIPMNSEFIGLLGLTRHGWKKFNGDDNPPTVYDYCISEEDALKPREDLGDNDESQWPLGFDRITRQDPWRQFYAVALQDRGASGELYTFNALGAGPPQNSVAINAVKHLLEWWRYCPNRKKGLRPIVRLQRRSWIDKKRGGGKRPKPVLKIVDWINPDGSSITAQQKHDEFGDKIPF